MVSRARAPAQLELCARLVGPGPAVLVRAVFDRDGLERLARGESAGNEESDEEVTLLVRKALSAVARSEAKSP